MKAELNNENKAKFFVLYWGQAIHTYKLSRFKTKRNIEVNGGSYGFLTLKPLSAINEQQITKIAEMSGIDGQTISSGLESGWKESFLAPIREMVKNMAIPFQVVDYLRSEGFLFDWMGLTPDEIIEAGWAKYREV